MGELIDYRKRLVAHAISAVDAIVSIASNRWAASLIDAFETNASTGNGNAGFALGKNTHSEGGK